MKILHLTAEFPPAPGYGLSRYVSELARALSSSSGGRHEVHVLAVIHDSAGEPPGEIVRDGVFVHRLPVKEKYPFGGYNEYLQAVLMNMPLASTLIQLNRERGPFELVVAHGWETSLAATLVQRVFGCRLVSEFGSSNLMEGAENGRAFTREEAYVFEMEKWFAGRSDRVVVPSESAKARLARFYGIPPDKVYVLPGAVRAEAFKVDVDAEEFRAMFAEPDEDIVLFAGRLARDKGPDLLIQAVPAILSSRPKAKFVLVGDGPMRQELQGLVELSPARSKISLKGHLGTAVLGALYQVSDVLVAPSRTEAFSFAALEAVMHHLPVIASKTGALVEAGGTAPDIVRLVEPGNPEALAKWVARSLESKRIRKRDPAPVQARVAEAYWPENVARQAELAFGLMVRDKIAA